MDSFERARKILGIANIALHHLDLRMRRQPLGAEQHQVVNNDPVAGLKELGNQDAALVAGAASHENGFA
jgi:hypothetical protein